MKNIPLAEFIYNYMNANFTPNLSVTNYGYHPNGDCLQIFIINDIIYLTVCTWYEENNTNKERFDTLCNANDSDKENIQVVFNYFNVRPIC